jgi:hypothetical protein
LNELSRPSGQASLFRQVTFYCQSHQFATSLFIFKGIDSPNQRLFAKVSNGQVTVYFQSHPFRESSSISKFVGVNIVKRFTNLGSAPDSAAAATISCTNFVTEKSFSDKATFT